MPEQYAPWSLQLRCNPVALGHHGASRRTLLVTSHSTTPSPCSSPAFYYAYPTALEPIWRGSWTKAPPQPKRQTSCEHPHQRHLPATYKSSSLRPALQPFAMATRLTTRHFTPSTLHRTLRITARTMASAEPRKQEFLVILPDKPDNLAKRLEVRPSVLPRSSHTHSAVQSLHTDLARLRKKTHARPSSQYRGRTLQDGR